MTNRPDTTSSAATAQRTLTCSRCGTAFACDLSGHCWCMDETIRLPMPVEGEDCLCQACLRAAAEVRTSPLVIPGRD